MSNDSELMTVYIPKDKAEHLVIKTLLESFGIECFLLNEGFADKDDINRNNIPLNCPACNSITEGLLQCPDCGLALFQNQL